MRSPQLVPNTHDLLLVCAKIILGEYLFEENLPDKKKRITVMKFIFLYYFRPNLIPKGTMLKKVSSKSHILLVSCGVSSIQYVMYFSCTVYSLLVATICIL